MKYLALVLVVSCSSFACFAQNPSAYRAFCDKANTQVEMTACASEEAARVDSKLNSTYGSFSQELQLNRTPPQE